MQWDNDLPMWDSELTFWDESLAVWDESLAVWDESLAVWDDTVIWNDSKGGRAQLSPEAAEARRARMRALNAAQRGASTSMNVA